MKTVLIIGGGLGGLSAAISLAFKGYDVTLFEKNNHFGGKLKPFSFETYRFDFGPNTITMPHVFQDVLLQTHANPDDYFQFHKLSSHTKNHFFDRSTFTMSTSQKNMIEQMEHYCHDSAEQYPKYLQKVRQFYQTSNTHFLRQASTSWKSFSRPSLLKAFLKVKPFQSLDKFHQTYFHHPFLQQSFNRYATYIGSSPYLAPATFAMIAHLELNEGVYFTKGGNVQIANGFVKRAQELGVTLKSNCSIKEIVIKNKKAVGVMTKFDEFIPGDIMILNGDILKSYPALVKEENRRFFSNKKIASISPSISAFVLLVGLRKRLKGLIHHQVFFSSNYKKEFDQLFNQAQLPKDPTIYISNSSYTEKAQSPNGDNLFILVNAPALSSEEASFSEDEYKETIYKKLARFGFDLKPHIVYEKTITQTQIANDFLSYKGALYGPSSNSFKGAFFRPQNKSTEIANLYFTGGTTHPGGGSPLVVLSGQNVAALI
ncbi:phytoene desaturase family protein [Alkalihalobacterium bogoriense]|uniref:phytoene desaturase family protein n=1 Tax=Alkalihalobacterium bogoriense TaxID=246272 RepID=UPI00047B0AEC|nr:phytoene desaturase family protein [Alkalihalobacterium bogoriense]